MPFTHIAGSYIKLVQADEALLNDILTQKRNSTVRTCYIYKKERDTELLLLGHSYPRKKPKLPQLTVSFTFSKNP